MANEKIRVTCPECGAKLRAPEDAVGKQAKCPSCGARIQIPSGASSEPETDRRRTEELASEISVGESRRKERKKQQEKERKRQEKELYWHNGSMFTSDGERKYQEQQDKERQNWQEINQIGHDGASHDAQQQSGLQAKLIQCPVCNKSISTEAEVCPECGHPIKKLREKREYEEQAAEMEERMKKFGIGCVVVIGILLLAGLIDDCGPDYGTSDKKPFSEMSVREMLPEYDRRMEQAGPIEQDRLKREYDRRIEQGLP